MTLDEALSSLNPLRRQEASAPPSGGVDDHADDFDFLSGLAHDTPTEPEEALAGSSDERWRQIRGLLAEELESPQWSVEDAALRLNDLLESATLDQAGALWAAHLMTRGGGDAPPLQGSGVSRMLVALLQQPSEACLVAATAAIERLRCAELQVEVATRLGQASPEVSFAAVEAMLNCLAEIGDGRCVRAMEHVLHERSGHLSEHQAWRARHIVQRIRRDHRR